MNYYRLIFSTAMLLVASIGMGAQNIVTFAEPTDPIAKEALETIDNDGYTKYTSDGMYTRRLVSTIHQPITLDELTEYTSVRSIQMTEYGLEIYDWFSCSFYFEEDEMCFRKTGGSQRKAGHLEKTSDTEVYFDGWWFYGSDPEVNDSEHKETGKLYKLADNKVVMYCKRRGTIEILEFARELAPKNMTVKDGKGYVYSFRINEDNFEELVLDRGGSYNGDITVPSTLTIDGREISVSAVGEGAMWKDEYNSKVGNVTSVTLPYTVYKIEKDAFRDNRNLKKVEYGKLTTVDARAFYGCPSLKLKAAKPAFGFTDAALETEYLHSVVAPEENADKNMENYNWAFFKDRHIGISFNRWKSMDIEHAMACWCANINFVKGAEYDFIDVMNLNQLFRGYLNEGSHDMLLLDNAYVGTHELPAFSRWISGEKEKSMPDSFKAAMSSKYKGEVDYSYEAGKVNDSGDQLVITEFKKKGLEAKIVLSWLSYGEEVCSYTKTAKLEENDQEYSVWNVDDDGTYGIPHILNIAYDEKGNVELFLLHYAPESRTYMHLKQNGKKLEMVDEEAFYVYYDPQLESIDATREEVMKAWTGETAPEEYALYDIDGDGTKELFLRSEYCAWESLISIENGKCTEIASYSTETNCWFQFGKDGHILKVDDNGFDSNEILSYQFRKSKLAGVYRKVTDYDEQNTVHMFSMDMKSGKFNAVKPDSVKAHFPEETIHESDVLKDRWNTLEEWIFKSE